MESYRVLQNVVVEGVDFVAGDIVPADEIPAGSRRSMLRAGLIECVVLECPEIRDVPADEVKIVHVEPGEQVELDSGEPVTESAEPVKPAGRKKGK